MSRAVAGAFGGNHAKDGADELDAETRDGIRRAVERVRSSGRTHWLGRVLASDVRSEDGLCCYAWAGLRDRFFWERVETGEFHCAWGVSDEFEGSGRDRFANVRTWSQDVSSRLEWVGAARPRSAATFVGGFAFEEEGPRSEDWKAFPAARFVLPEAIVERHAGASRSVLFVRIEPGATAETVEGELAARSREIAAARKPVEQRIPDAPRERIPVAPECVGFGEDARGPEYRVRSDRENAVFEDQVEQALAAIDAGRLEKVVLARSIRVDHDGELEVPGFLARLRSLYPTCTLVAVGRGRDSFLAATPETLIRVQGRRVETAALAGSAPRGRQPEEDRALAESLLSSEKERAEHAHVVDAIRRVLEPRCEAFESSEEPALRALFGIQHLETTFRGTLRATPGDGGSVEPGGAVDLLALAAELHPTPAVGGVPAESARDWIRRFEGLDRGWYASPVGWLDAEGGGDLCVALRSALVRNGLRELGAPGASRALLFAGAGVVAGSDPAQELVETRIKLRALLAPLTEI